MKIVQLPNSDLRVSQLVFGCWGITSDFHWGERDEQESIATIQAALDGGVNFFDTAEVYGDGNSELLLAKALAGKRDQVVLASKMRPDSMQPAQVIEACERSLQRLGTDYLDLYQIHWPRRDVALSDTWSAMIKLRDQGKVKSIAACNLGLGDLAEVSRATAPVTDQLPYNLIWRAIEDGILPYCREHNIGVLVYSPLMHGLLAGKYQTAADVPDGRARSRHFNTERSLARHGEPGCEDETFAALAAIQEVSDGLGRTIADVALAWVAAQPGVSCVIVGARNPAQLNENIATLERPLPADAVEKLNSATDALKATLGPNPDMWQGSENSRYR